ncbi:hypothetical protein SAMN05518801_108153 [Novosphingobium sp. CF614]|uniref:hypothetical protein n=1 Tax=Novosphingobium sp. CF614 TaxID=1884364 RepID=UPI0008E4F514|nr:hypothetical protein [Novosphingobium sp. CF614]SFG15713.1 hypothetical protein SAMN05518801_108153 [Novosphingobium sp. CF614]
METPGQEVHLNKEEARAGYTPRIVRYVLLVSLALAIVALSAIWITSAVSSRDDIGQAAREGNGPALGR